MFKRVSKNRLSTTTTTTIINMPPKPRGKGKATIAEIRSQAQASGPSDIAPGVNRRPVRPPQGERPPTTEEWNAMVQQSGGAAAAAAAASSSSGVTKEDEHPREISFTKNSKNGPKVPKQSNQQKQQQAEQKKSAFIPPGAEFASRNSRNKFKWQFESHFSVPKRLRDVPTSLVEAVNDWHYSMMNDHRRNEFYETMLKDNIVPGVTTVLEIGAGSGLLSLMAAKLGAKWVIAVEGSEDMARLAQRNIDINGCADKVRVLNKLSTDLRAKELPSKPDIVVSEIFGTLLMGESALEYISELRNRKDSILRPDTKILPRYGRQYCSLIECPVIDQICGVSKWGDIDLSHMNSLRDTSSCVFTKKYGFRMSSVEHKRLTEPVLLLDVDFHRANVEDVPIEFNVGAKLRAAGTAHAFLFWWVVYNNPDDIKGDKFMVRPEDGCQAGFDQGRVMSTCPYATTSNFCRDMQWGQALQLLDAGGNQKNEKGFMQISEAQKNATDEPLVLQVVTSYDRVILQCLVDTGTVDEGYDDEEEGDEEGGDFDEEAWEDEFQK